MRNCYRCGKQISSKVRYCRYCGADQEECCPGCGWCWQEGELFCPICGKKREMGSASSTPNVQPLEETPKNTQIVDKILELIKSNAYLVFCILYSVQLVGGLMNSNIVGNLFVLITCVAIWLIYADGRAGTLNTTGLTMINVMMWIRAGSYGLIGLLVLTLSGYLGGAYTVILIGIVALFAGYYWYLGYILSGIKKYARGIDTPIKVGIYPLIVMGIDVLGKFMNLVGGNIVASILGTALWRQAGSGVIGAIYSLFGANQNVLVRLAALAIPVLELYFLVKIREYSQENS